MPFSLPGAKVPPHFRSRERKFQETKVPPVELSLVGAKVRGNESSSYAEEVRRWTCTESLEAAHHAGNFLKIYVQICSIWCILG